MGYLLWFGIVVIAFMWMHFFTSLSFRQKWITLLLLTLIIANAILYNIMKDLESKHINEMQLKYTNGETLRCNGVNVNRETFGYSVGTQSFIGNQGTRYPNQIFSAAECR
ncbi:MAG TPA: hypothetical protein PLM93_03555 [Sulfuricurvum sp.]|nr:MAG: hypothetical protein B7Y30_06475 [Campylobacterales bacterium 16-40-21]OZA04240.1 MAG: hypothetical protein B7X89_01405 [Sulfuricurvum sp. 17-40-25]HQS66252.1 hypothetical protein [Sulfuricurvum sp.]HQT36861.1 hypothetical protein [Sulfuricurvum sp.]